MAKKITLENVLPLICSEKMKKVLRRFKDCKVTDEICLEDALEFEAEIGHVGWLKEKGFMDVIKVGDIFKRKKSRGKDEFYILARVDECRKVALISLDREDSNRWSNPRPVKNIRDISIKEFENFCGSVPPSDFIKIEGSLTLYKGEVKE